jgi:hypothetical protein
MARQQLGQARRLRKWHGNPGEVLADQAVTPAGKTTKPLPQ